MINLSDLKRKLEDYFFLYLTERRKTIILISRIFSISQKESLNICEKWLESNNFNKNNDDNWALLRYWIKGKMVTYSNNELSKITITLPTKPQLK